jgi:hypothetical protein
MTDLCQKSPTQLLQLHAQVIEELQARDIVRTQNNPVGDYTEWLVCKCLNLQMESNSKAGFDAVDATGKRYQIKGRRESGRSVQFSVIRNLHDDPFDFVVAIAFNSDYSIRFAVRLTHESVGRLATFRQHVNGHILNLTDSHVGTDGVEDIKETLLT